MIEYLENTHTYLIDGVITPSVTQVLSKIFPSKYVNIPIEILNAKAEYGTELHQLIEDYNNGCEVSTDDVLKVGSLIDYQKIKKDNGVEVIDQEKIVSYEKMFAGRYDIVAKVNGELSLIDIKTTARLDEEYLSWQLGMYVIADGRDFKHTYCLWLPKKKQGQLIEIKPKTKKEIIDKLKELGDEAQREWGQSKNE